MANETAEPREVGIDLPPVHCPACGKETGKVANDDGSFSSEDHSGCYKAPTKKDIHEAEKARETPVETGVDKENS